MQDERGELGWEQIPTCLQCSYQVFVRSTAPLIKGRYQPRLPVRG